MTAFKALAPPLLLICVSKSHARNSRLSRCADTEATRAFEGHWQDMIGRDFVKRLRLLFGRTETIKTRFEFDKAGRLVEHIVVETHDMPKSATQTQPGETPKGSKA